MLSHHTGMARFILENDVLEGFSACPPMCSLTIRIAVGFFIVLPSYGIWLMLLTLPLTLMPPLITPLAPVLRALRCVYRQVFK